MTKTKPVTYVIILCITLIGCIYYGTVAGTRDSEALTARFNECVRNAGSWIVTDRGPFCIAGGTR